VSEVEMTARDWYAEGLRIGAQSQEQRILFLLAQEAERTAVGTFNANGVLLKLISRIEEQNK
jgi:hypothetical protein